MKSQICHKHQLWKIIKSNMREQGGKKNNKINHGFKKNHKALINCSVFAFSGQQLSVSMVIKIIMKTYAKIYLAGFFSPKTLFLLKQGLIFLLYSQYAGIFISFGCYYIFKITVQLCFGKSR